MASSDAIILPGVMKEIYILVLELVVELISRQGRNTLKVESGFGDLVEVEQMRY